MTMTAVLDNIRPAPADAPAPAAAPAAEQVSNELTELLDLGKFAAYHLAKAKAALERNDIPAAYYQIRASLAHDSLPEAVAMKADLKKRLKKG